LEINKLLKSIELLEVYVEREKYAGFDPYDGLQSPLAKMPVFRTNKLLRFYFQQIVKRFPLNLRCFLGIKKGKNPVTLGLCIQAYSYLSEVYPEKNEIYNAKIEKLIDELIEFQSKGFSGACWGYEFDWEARYAKIPAFQPNIVATGIITNALFESWKINQNERCKELILSSSNFVLKDLNRTENSNELCFSYSPFDKQTVLNASMKAVRILAQTYELTKDECIFPIANAAVQYLVNRQNKDGSFFYSDKGNWIDNYHTGYILDCLDSFLKHFQSIEYKQNLDVGLEFYFANFFTNSGICKFYNNQTFPIDTTSISQSILSLTKFGKIENAKQIASWSIENMQSKKGYFYFRKFKHHTIKTSFMRWSNAWIFASFSFLAHNSKLYEKN
jgi:hypothetical protein